MTRVLCGWCGNPTAPAACLYCGRDPALPWRQRATAPPTVEEHDAGRPALDEKRVRRQYEEARAALVAEGREPTIDALSERLDRSPRTIREWRKRFGL